MLRFPLLAALVVVAWGAVVAPAPAAFVGERVAGEVEAIALSGDALVVARKVGRRTVVERRVPGRAPVVLLRLSAAEAGDGVQLAASAEALAVSLSGESEDDEGGVETAPSKVMIGPAGGPLREVAGCARTVFGRPVAVDGPRVAWSEGGCGLPTESTREADPVSVAVGAVDPAVAVRRHPVPDDRFPLSMALRGDDGILGVVRPSFFTFISSEVRAFGPGGNDPIARDPAGFVLAVGLFANGVGVLARVTEDDDVDEDDRLRRPRCGQELLAIGPGSTGRRSLPVGGCLAGEDGDLEVGAVTAGDRVAALTEPDGARSRRDVALVTAREGGADRRVVATGRYREPLGLAGAPGRVAWWQARCTGGQELVVADAVPRGSASRAIGACRAEILTRRARPARDGRVTIRLRCPRGCTGRATDVTSCSDRRVPARFSFGPGTHRLRVRTLPRTRRSRRLLLEVTPEHGPRRMRAVRLSR